MSLEVCAVVPPKSRFQGDDLVALFCWAALKSAWRRPTPLICLNCDQPTLLSNFGFPWSGMFSRRPLFVHTCGKCRRLFEDRSVGDVGKWIVKNLEAEVWPDYDMVWDRTREWEPPLNDLAAGSLRTPREDSGQ